MVSNDEFKKKLNAVYSGKQGDTGITEDMIITGNSEEEHDHTFLHFLQITRSNYPRLNGEKLQFKLKEISFFGHRESSDGLGPDPKKIKPILKMQMPEDKKSIKSFWGMLNFLGRFLQQVL